MKKIIQALFITLSQFLVFAQPNDLETPVSIINDGLDTQAQMGSVFTLDGTNSYTPMVLLYLMIGANHQMELK